MQVHQPFSRSVHYYFLENVENYNNYINFTLSTRNEDRAQPLETITRKACLYGR